MEVVAVNAVDPDGDPLTYTFDWGDGSEPASNGGGMAEHGYPADQFQAYTIIVTVPEPDTAANKPQDTPPLRQAAASLGTLMKHINN